jgi:molybdopterin molybdotransferase
VSELLTIDAALERILARAHPMAVETVAVPEAGGRVLREPATAQVDLPPFPSSAMDGFALRSTDAPGELPVAYRVAAGSPPPGPLPPGAAAGISTGATVPAEADAVIPVENVDDLGSRVRVSTSVASGQHVRPRGGDTRLGDVVVAPGARIGPAQIGALAAAGIASVTCSVKPRAVVIATGSELRAPGDDLAPGQIYESNRAMLAALLTDAGARVELVPVVEDDPGTHRDAVMYGLDADVLVTSGGVSMGEHDLVRRVEADLGVEEIFWGVAVKPGKPLSFGVRGETLVFGLPGNPVSALVSALLFVRTGLLARQCAMNALPRYALGYTTAALRGNPARDEFVRARRLVEGSGVRLEPIAGQESHMIARAALADALMHVPRGESDIAAGSLVRYLSLD